MEQSQKGCQVQGGRRLDSRNFHTSFYGSLFGKPFVASPCFLGELAGPTYSTSSVRNLMNSRRRRCLAHSAESQSIQRALHSTPHSAKRISTGADTRDMPDVAASAVGTAGSERIRVELPTCASTQTPDVHQLCSQCISSVVAYLLSCSARASFFPQIESYTVKGKRAVQTRGCHWSRIPGCCTATIGGQHIVAALDSGPSHHNSASSPSCLGLEHGPRPL